jgi:hypothetical protein
VQQHTFSFEIDATPEEVWRVLHRPMKAGHIIEHGDVRIEIVHPGDEHGEGLVRRCRFPVPKLLLSGGVGHSWECVAEVRPNEFSRYDAVGKPLWSEATGWHRLDDLGGGRTRVNFGETYHAFNPVARAVLERYVHSFISKDNDRVIREAVTRGVAAARRVSRP